MAVPKAVLAEAQKLRAEIERHNHQYYVLDQPLVSDAEFDRLFRQLQHLELEHPELVDPESPTQRVGGSPLPVPGFGGAAITTGALNGTTMPPRILPSTLA